MAEPVPEWAQDIRERIVRIETKIDDTADTREKAESAEARSKENDRRLSKLEESHTWLWRTVGGAIVTGAVALIVNWANHGH